MAKKNSFEDKLLRAFHSLFILNAAQLGMGGAEMRRILGIAMNDVTPVLKAVNRALKKQEKQRRNQL